MQINERCLKHRKVNEVLRSVDWSYLADFNPKLVGTFPIDIDVEDSDLDIICTFDEPDIFIEALNHYSHLEAFDLTVGSVILCHFEVTGIPFEIYGSQEPIEMQNGYRHMKVEEACMKRFGEDFRKEIRKLKSLGLKTEPAFALLLNLYGNPYKRLLDEDWSYPENWYNPLNDLDLKLFHLSYLNKGWSHDLKLVGQSDQGKVLIRITPLESHGRKYCEFQQMSQLKSSFVNLPKCIEYRCLDRAVAVYQWVEGDDLETRLTDMSPDRQYALGLAAGKGLRDIQVEAGTYDWAETYKGKIQRVIQNYESCGIAMPGSDQVIAYILDHQSLLEGRPIVFQHGDYHIGNMVVSKEERLGIVDFNRSSTGDPWEEYDRFVFTWRVSPLFAYGQLKGYFGDIPEDFFKLMALYNGLNALSAIPWAIPYGPEDVAVMKANYMTLMVHYEGFTNHIPKWYKDVKEEFEALIGDKI